MRPTSEGMVVTLSGDISITPNMDPKDGTVIPDGVTEDAEPVEEGGDPIMDANSRYNSRVIATFSVGLTLYRVVFGGAVHGEILRKVSRRVG